MELGTHTARMLVARSHGGAGVPEVQARFRRYVRLAEGFEGRDRGMISSRALERAVKAVGDLAFKARQLGALEIRGVATGLIREAVNREVLLEAVEKDAGVRLEIISGEEEAVYTAKGILSALGRPSTPYLLFDLGGGTTEFIWETEGGLAVRSLSFGAAVLTERFLQEDPPLEAGLRAVEQFVESALVSGLPGKDFFHPGPELIGSGGTATTLAAMVHEVEPDDVRPELMNGLVLEREALEGVYSRVAAVPESERDGLKGLDSGRARVIPAGTLAILGIMGYFGARSMRVCLSDILEGLLMDDTTPLSGVHTETPTGDDGERIRWERKTR